MLVAILIFDAALVAWSLHLMREAVTYREFSLMLAGMLVALSASALLLVYFIMSDCLSYLSQSPSLGT